MINSLGRRCYKAAATQLSTHKQTKMYAIGSLALQVRKEMSDICSLQHNSLLRDSHKAIKEFSWQAIQTEFAYKLPTLLALLKGILPKSDDKFLTFVIAMILKKKCKHMSLVQHVISVLLYGNATSKEVDNMFMMCINHFICLGVQLSAAIYGLHVIISHITRD